MYNTKLPPMSARPSLAYSGRLVYPAWTSTPLPSFNGWVHRGGRIVLHRSVGTPRETTVAVVICGRAWCVDSGPSAKARDLARRIELAVADIPQDLWAELDSCDEGYHPSSQRWGEFVDAFDRHNARTI
jgi:hypothetical protein